MLCQNETGVISGSEIFFNTIDPQTARLFYYIGCCGHYYCEHGYQINRNYMDCMLLMQVEKGTMRLGYRGKEYTMQPGSLALLDGTFPQQYSAMQYVEFYWLHLSGANSPDLCEHLTRMHGSILYDIADKPGVAETVRKLVSQFATGQAANDVEQSQLLYQILCGLMPQSAPKIADGTNPVQQAIQYIQDNLGGDLSLKRIAAEVHLSPPHLSRLFRAEQHRSPHEYIIEVRMNRAKHLLKTTTQPIKAIAMDVGYGSEASFIGAFTERIGISPRRFRELPLG